MLVLKNTVVLRLTSSSRLLKATIVWSNSATLGLAFILTVVSWRFLWCSMRGTRRCARSYPLVANDTGPLLEEAFYDRGSPQIFSQAPHYRAPHLTRKLTSAII